MRNALNASTCAHHSFDVLVIAADTGDEILIAFTKDNVPEIDIKNGRLTVAVPDEIDAGDREESDRGEE